MKACVDIFVVTKTKKNLEQINWCNCFTNLSP